MRSRPAEGAALVSDLSEANRARMAVYCFARAHLREHGRSIAWTCSRENLASVGGLLGASLYEQLAVQEIDPRSTGPAKRPITLAGSFGQVIPAR